MDEGLSDAVRKVFVKLYKEGLIYRDKRLVNWDPKLHTAILRPGGRGEAAQGDALAFCAIPSRASRIAF